MAPDKTETQAFIPTKVIDCSFQDVCAITSIITIITLFTIAGIIVGALSATNNDRCARDLPFQDSQSFTFQFNSSAIKNMYIGGDLKTTIYFDTTLTNKIEVFVNRSSLLDQTYTNINTTIYSAVENGTSVLRINTTIPTTDFTNCYYASRIIRLPANLATLTVQISNYANDLIFMPDPNTNPSTNLRLKSLTVMTGTNLVNITQVQSGQIFMSGRKGQVYLSKLFGAALIVSTSGDITYSDLSSAVALSLYTTKGTLQGSSITSVANGTVTLIAIKKKQTHQGIKGAKLIEIGTEDGEIDASLNNNDFQGELQIQASNLDESTIQSTYYPVVKYSSLDSRKQYPTDFGGNAAEIFTPNYAGTIGDPSFASTRLMKIRVKKSGKLLNLKV